MLKVLDSYTSYMDCQLFLPYLEEHGTSALIEASGGTERDAPMGERIGAVVRSVKELHLPRYSYGGHVQISTEFVDNGDIPAAPEGTTWIGIFYFGELGETCQGETDSCNNESWAPGWGDMVFFRSDYTYTPGNLTEGKLPKLVAFWGDLE